jgi:hypothetical protein
MNTRIDFLVSLSGLFIVAGASAIAAPLADVPAGHWAAPAVHSVVAKKIMTGAPNGKFNGDKPVTRYELAVALDHFVTYIEAGRKPLHPMAAKIVPSIGSSAPPAVRAAMIHLASNGFLPGSSPLLKGKGTETVTAQQLSDALAEITIRLSDRSLPPNKQ